MALSGSHVSSREGTQPGTTSQGRYLTRRLYDGMGCTKDQERVASSRQQRETMRWKEGDRYHQTVRAPLTKKGSNRRDTCTSANNNRQSAFSRSSKP